MLKEYVGSLVRISSKNGRGCRGLVIDANDNFIKIKFVDGRKITIAIDQIEYITKTREQNLIDRAAAVE